MVAHPSQLRTFLVVLRMISYAMPVLVHVLRLSGPSSSPSCLYEKCMIGVSVKDILLFLSSVCQLFARYVLVLYLDGAVHKAPSQIATLNNVQ